MPALETLSLASQCPAREEYGEARGHLIPLAPPPHDPSLGAQCVAAFFPAIDIPGAVRDNEGQQSPSLAGYEY
jgi:hypothetical protein